MPVKFKLHWTMESGKIRGEDLMCLLFYERALTSFNQDSTSKNTLTEKFSNRQSI